MWDPYAQFESTTLSNGLTVHAAHWPGRPWEALGFLVYSGSEQDPIGLEGLAHFTEHLVSMNAPLPREKMQQFFDYSGGNVDFGTTSYTHTLYRCFVPNAAAVLSEIFSLFGSMLLMETLDQHVEHEREIIVGEFYRHYPLTCDFDLALRRRKALYKELPMGRSTRALGNLESIRRITQEDLQTFYEKNYTPSNMSIVAVGGATMDELIKLLDQSPLIIQKKGERTLAPPTLENFPPPLETHYVFTASQEIGLSTPFSVGRYETTSRIPRTINESAVKITRDIVDEALNDEVREQRMWSYGCGVDWHNFRSLYELNMVCPGLTLSALDEIEEVVQKCIDSLYRRSDLWENFKHRAIAQKSMVDLTAIKVCDGALADLADENRIISLAEERSRVELVTMDDICRVLDWLQPKQRWTLITKP